MERVQSSILKVKKRLDSGSLDDTKILRYLKALDQLPIEIDTLKSTGIGKTVNNLRKKGGSIADLSKALVRKWKDLVSINDSPNKKNSSPLNTLSSDFKPDELLTSRQSDVCPENFSKNHTREKLVNSTVMLENKEHKKQKAPSMQLCDLSFVSEEPVVKKTKKSKQKISLASSSRSSMLSSSSLPTPEELGASLLPDIQPNYIPQKLPDFADDSSPRKKKAVTSTDIPADLLSSRKSKTQVFSGRRSANRSGVVLSLHEMCIRILIENVEALCDTGGVPYDILEPVLSKCTPAQLWNLEDYNSYFKEDTGPLWKTHCHKDFKGSVPEEHDNWRALYLEKHEERERKLKSINAKINASQAAKTPVRQVKLAYIQTQAKAPPQVRRKQMKHGTGDGVIVPPPPKMRGSSSMSSIARPSVISPRKPKTTPLMKKVKQMGSLQRSRARSGIIRR